MLGRGNRFNSNGDVAFGVFRRIGGQLIDDQAKLATESRRQCNIAALNIDGVTGLPLEQETREPFPQVQEVGFEVHFFLAIDRMQPLMHASQRGDASSRYS